MASVDFLSPLFLLALPQGCQLPKPFWFCLLALPPAPSYTSGEVGGVRVGVRGLPWWIRW